MKKYTKEIHECYHRLFQASTPKGDFYKMLEEAEINDQGQKIIPFENYELEYNTFQNILENCIKEFKIPKHAKQSFSTTIYLGCSPKYKINSIPKLNTL